MSRPRSVPLHECAADVHDAYGVSFHPCGVAARFEEDGQWWCGTHRPSKARARAAAREDAYQAKRRADEERFEHARLLTHRLGSHVSVHYDSRTGRTTDHVTVSRDALISLLDEVGR